MIGLLPNLLQTVHSRVAAGLRKGWQQGLRMGWRRVLLAESGWRHCYELFMPGLLRGLRIGWRRGLLAESGWRHWIGHGGHWSC